MTRPRLIVSSAGMRRIAALPVLLDDYELVFEAPSRPRPEDSVLAWGRRPSAVKAMHYAGRHGLRVLHIEDGFLRSVGLGAKDPPLALVLDDLGLYLDADRPSRLESLIRKPLTEWQRDRARVLQAAWRDGQVSKYNHSRDIDGIEPGYVLVVDQTLGDASISCGWADAGSFQRMLQAAWQAHPDKTILLKVHPDVVSGRKKGYFDLRQVRSMPRVHILDHDAHPASLLKHAAAVYAVTSQMGFEALIWGRPVHLFGMPFYGGWGLTHDEQAPPDRRGQVSLEQLIHAVLIDYSRYIDPETGARCEAETVLQWLALQRRMRQRFASRLTAMGFSNWKKPFVREFFNGSQVKFARRARVDDPTLTLAVWGRKHDALLEAKGPVRASVVRLEDGFLRSVGLGADLIRPLSWVQDDLGIYYDATVPSRLERLLAEAVFEPALLDRSAALRRAILEAGVTKYNLAGQVWQRPSGDRRVLLVPGQVETDASIRYGGSGIQRNIDLLRAVREAEPDAYILYKPHPDVLAGLRQSGRGEDEAGRWCDEIIENAAFDALLGQVDAVHVLTSLGGFEALMRDVPVVTYGQPFYAGWGLTLDRYMCPEVQARRSRVLTLDQLVAATLILYPTYVSRVTHRYTTPENALRELIAWRAEGEGARPSWWRRFIARLTRKQ